MQKTSRTPRPTNRSVRWLSAMVAVATIASGAGCGGEVSGPGGKSGGTAGAKTAGRGGSAGKGASAGAGNAAGSTVSTGGAGAVAGSGAGSGGTVTASGGMGTGGSAGVTSGGMSGGGGVASGGVAGGAGTVAASGGVGGAEKPCVDVEPPPDPNWPDATCAKWAAETSECTASWFATYCDVSCGRCVPQGGGGTGGMSSGGAGGMSSGGAAGTSAVDCSTMGLPNVTGSTGYATRYWDCCQTHCAQFDGHRCGQDGVSSTGDQNSACSGGGSYACYDESPHAVNDCLSYGYIAKANPNCGGCYRIQFTGEGQYSASDPGSNAIKGKQMIVKVSNTGGDVANNQFDLMIPGGGVGQNNACSKQWGTSDLGAQYGGFLTNCTGTYDQKKDCVRQNCMKIPAGKARDGCIWFIDWYQIADNPKFTSQATDCPF